MGVLVVVLLLTFLPGVALAQEQRPAGQVPVKAISATRAQLEQEEERERERAHANAAPAPSAEATSVSGMRATLSEKLEQIDEHFRCQKVDIEGNPGNVVLVCGDNNGLIGASQRNVYAPAGRVGLGVPGGSKGE